MSIKTVRSIAKEHFYEAEKTKGSRFLGHIFPCESMDRAKIIIEELRRSHPDANHHCWAWQGAHRDEFRYSDDGEPSGSAGKPIHNAILGRHLVGVLAVVVRYFGGTKLGTGGLVRAYGGCAAEALDTSPIVETVVTSTLVFRADYEKVGLVRSIVSSMPHATLEAEFGEDVIITVRVPVGLEGQLQTEIQERSAGRVIVETS